MKTQLLQDPEPKTDQGGTLSKKHLRDRLVKPTYKFAKSVTEINNRVQKPKTYNETISDSIHGNRWCEAIDKEL